MAHMRRSQCGRAALVAVFAAISVDSVRSAAHTRTHAHTPARRHWGSHALAQDYDASSALADEDGHVHIEHALQVLEVPNFRWAEGVGIGLGLGNASVSVTPTHISNGDTVTVSVTASNPRMGDWVGVYSPWPIPGGQVNSTTPVKFAFLNNDPAYFSAGTSNLAFTLTNMRSEMGFVVFANGLRYAIAVAISPDVVSFDDPDAPLKVRAAGTEDPDVYTITWSSLTHAAPVVRWGTVSGQLDHEVAATWRQLTVDEMCGYPADSVGWHDLGSINTARLTGLRPFAGQKIYYTVGDNARNVTSQEFELQLALAPGDTSRPTRIITFGDMGRGSDDDAQTWNEYGQQSINTTHQLLRDINSGTPYDVVFHFGDISYATGYLSVWDSWLDMIEPVASRISWIVGVGNHESDQINSASFFNKSDSHGECGVPTTALLQLPKPATTNEPWFSMNVGIVHLVMMSSEHNFTTGSPQWQWLQADLAGVDRSITPWVIAALHRPMYIDSIFGGKPDSDLVVSALMQEHVEPLFYKYRVNLALYGHNHSVQRLAAALKNRAVQRSTPVQDSDGNIVYLHEDPQATVHMVAGTAGANFTVNNANPAPGWSEKVFFEFGYAHIIAYNSSYLAWEWVENIHGEVRDRMAITQPNPFAPWGKASDPAKLSSGAIAGIVIGGLAATAVVLVLAVYAVRGIARAAGWGGEYLDIVDQQPAALHRPLVGPRATSSVGMVYGSSMRETDAHV